MQLIQSASCNSYCRELSLHSLNQLTPIIDGYEELERGNNIPKAVIATISLGIPAFSKVVAPTVGKWVGSATIGTRLVGGELVGLLMLELKYITVNRLVGLPLVLQW